MVLPFYRLPSRTISTTIPVALLTTRTAFPTHHRTPYCWTFVLFTHCSSAARTCRTRAARAPFVPYWQHGTFWLTLPPFHPVNFSSLRRYAHCIFYARKAFFYPFVVPDHVPAVPLARCPVVCFRALYCCCNIAYFHLLPFLPRPVPLRLPLWAFACLARVTFDTAVRTRTAHARAAPHVYTPRDAAGSVPAAPICVRTRIFTTARAARCTAHRLPCAPCPPGYLTFYLRCHTHFTYLYCGWHLLHLGSYLCQLRLPTYTHRWVLCTLP